MILEQTEHAVEVLTAPKAQRPEPVETPEPHEHEYKRIPKGQRTDRLTFCCTMYRCDCGDSYTC